TRWSGTADAVYSTIDVLPPEAIARYANRMERWAKATTSDTDVMRRRWIKFDFDPSRMSKTSSTDQQHAAAIDRIRECAEWLKRELDWPALLIGDSGNGGHGLARIDLPNDAESKHLIVACLAAGAAKFDTKAMTLDQSVFNAARVWKVPGTLAAKGDNLPQYPHRIARLLEVPEPIEIVTVERLQRLARPAPT